MKNLRLISMFLVCSVLLIGCTPKVEESPAVETPIVETPAVTTPEPAEVSLKDKIEDFSSYTLVTDPSITSFVPTCDGYSQEFAKKVDGGDIKRLLLYGDGDYALDVMMTPNYDNWTEADFDKVNDCGELGSVLAVKIVEDSLLWSYPHCSAGAVPTEKEPGYVYYKACLEVETKLAKYLFN